MARELSLHRTSVCGARPTNEDVEKFKMNLPGTFKYQQDLTSAPVDFFCVLDGHGGDAVSKFVADLLLKYLTRKNLQFPLSSKYVKDVYNHIQQKLVVNPECIASTCGCTALVVIRYLGTNSREQLQVINLGDCRSVLSRKGLPIQLTKDHKPYWPDEKKRIDEVNAKHTVVKKIHFEAGDWRVGDLSVSRAFGDLDNVPHITHIPDIFHYNLLQDDEFIVLACDGVWDVLRNEDVVNFIRDNNTKSHLETYQIPGKYPTKIPDDNNIARKLAEYAIARGSTDNVSVLIVFLLNPGDPYISSYNSITTTSKKTKI
jgi:serine/threonine protein phosphatase PrpC